LTQTRQQRRASDRSGRGRFAGPLSSRAGLLTIGGIAAAALAVVVWYVASRPPIRDGAPSWSPDSRHIVFYSESGGAAADLYVMDADGSNRRALMTTVFSEGAPAYSPNGAQIAYDTDRDGNFEIYVMNADGHGQKRLTNNPARDLAPAWAPDGSRIAFMSDRASRPEFDVFVMKADGSGVERLTTGQTSWFPQFASDGRRIALHIGRDVHILDAPSKILKRLTFDPQNGMYPTWSPDGLQIAFMSWRNGSTEIFTMNADGTNQKVLVSMARGSVIDPRWSPDGTKIVFVHVPEERVHDQQSESQERVIYTVELASGKMTRLSR